MAASLLPSLDFPAAYTAAVTAMWLEIGCALLLGLLLGSFLNVCIARIPVGQSVATPRSRCEACGHAIRWYDNIPLFSFFLLRAACRDCKGAIPWRYPAVELATAIWFVFSTLPLWGSTGLSGDAFGRLILQQVGVATLGWLLIGLMVIDWKYQRLPDVLTFPGILIGLLLICAQAILLGPNEDDLVLQRQININSANAGRSTGNVFLTGPEHLVYGRLLAVVVAFLALYLVRILYRIFRKRDGMGLGDAKLLAMIASFLGLAPAALRLFVGAMLATLFAIMLLTRGRANAATRLPFGSFLAAGGMVAALLATPLLGWYLGLFS